MMKRAALLALLGSGLAVGGPAGTRPVTAAKPVLGMAADAALENAKDDGGLDAYGDLSFAGAPSRRCTSHAASVARAQAMMRCSRRTATRVHFRVLCL